MAGSHQRPVLLSRTETSTLASDRLSVTRPETTSGTSVALLLAGEVRVSVGRENWYAGLAVAGSKTTIRSLVASATYTLPLRVVRDARRVAHLVRPGAGTAPLAEEGPSVVLNACTRDCASSVA